MAGLSFWRKKRPEVRCEGAQRGCLSDEKEVSPGMLRAGNREKKRGNQQGTVWCEECGVEEDV